MCKSFKVQGFSVYVSRFRGPITVYQLKPTEQIKRIPEPIACVVAVYWPEYSP